jgi:hypothetical protein
MIKLFEEYNQWYTEITFNQYMQVINNIDEEGFPAEFPKDRETFNDVEIHQIEKFISDYKNYQFEYSLNPGIGKYIKIDLDYKYSQTGSFLSVSINKIEDEWYYIRVSGFKLSLWFKCDQFDGVIKLLDDNLTKWSNISIGNPLYENNGTSIGWEKISAQEYSDLLVSNIPDYQEEFTEDEIYQIQHAGPFILNTLRVGQRPNYLFSGSQKTR